jgi:membrane-anchored protein YejM (alkaline phosphatase superfamily)
MANAVLLGVISLRYLGNMDPGNSLAGWVYLLTTYLSHHAVLATVPLFVVAGPLIFLLPRQRAVTLLAVVAAAAFMALLTLDSLLWSQSRFHLNLFTMRILGSQSWLFAGVMFLIGLTFETMLARGIWGWVRRRDSRRGGWLGAFVAVNLLVAQGIHAWAEAAYYTPVTSIANQVPLYRGVKAKTALSRLGLVDIRQSRERGVAQRLSRDMDAAANRSLNYPLEPLRCPAEEPLNLLLIVVDGLRADTVTQATMPRVHAVARLEASWFTEHFSGGNSSRMGHFSLYYGLPPVYFDSFAAEQRASVLMDELQRRDYQLGIFSSSDMYRPAALDRTVFANVPKLENATPLPDASSAERVTHMNAAWLDWIGAADTTRPWFGFLLYDSTTLLDQDELRGAWAAAPADERRARYHEAMQYNDALIGRVLADLQSRGLRERTVVVISSDHGEEFDTRELDRKGHGSGYSRAQLQVPMIIAWPGRGAQVVRHRTSHYDFVPTLMTGMFGCTNPASDYSSGTDLYSGREWNWLVAGSYYNYAVLEPDQITVTYPRGTFEVRDWDYRILENPEFRADVLQAIIDENQRFLH